jgi:hypothetical protein
MRLSKHLLLTALAACQGPNADASGFGTAPGAPGTSAASPSTTTGTGSTSGHVDEDSSESAGGSAGETTAPVLDVGLMPDLMTPQPVGCKGKIDFLFMMSGQTFMSEIQTQLIDGFPKFIDTIETKFADFDYHIMVVDGDRQWGLGSCDEECPNIDPDPPCTLVDVYPCDALDTISACDETMGAGTIFNAGALAPNVPCDVVGGHRYLTKDQPDLAETFACMARRGESGGDRLCEALAAAVSPELNGPGGCNEGFLREDALLVVTFVTASPDYDSQGTPEEWEQAVLDAKHGDANAIVMFGLILKTAEMEWCENTKHPIEQFICRFPQRYIEWSYVKDYGPAFEAATEMVKAACDAFIPG